MNIKIVLVIALLVGITGVGIFILGNPKLPSPKDSIPQTKDTKQKKPPVKPTLDIPDEEMKVLSTEPKQDTANVYPGEMEIKIQLNKPVISESDISFSLTPKEPYSWKFTNSYPTGLIIVKIYGGLKSSTKYQASFKTNQPQGEISHTWEFTTSAQKTESSSALVAEYEKQLAKNYYPLDSELPYYGDSFAVGYSGRFSLLVEIKNPDVERVKLEVLEWIKSKGVDPGTHTIKYVNKF